MHRIQITISNAACLRNAVFSQLTDGATCSNQQRAAYFERKHPSACDEESRAAIRGRLVQELLMRNGLSMYQVEKEPLLTFFFLASFSYMDNIRSNFEYF